MSRETYKNMFCDCRPLTEQEMKDAIKAMSKEKQTEIHELAKKMSEAISTEVKQQYIKDEAKLQAVLIENGWCKSTDLAEEIFAEIEKLTYRYLNDAHYIMGDMILDIAELKNKYTEEEK